MPSASVAQPLIPNASVPELPQPYLVFLGDACDISFAKTAHGLRDWAPERCVGELACAGERISIGLPALSPGEAKALSLIHI